MTRRHLPFWRQWGWPLFLAVLTIVGLLAALIGEGGIWWWISWAALGAPMLVIGRFALLPAGSKVRSENGQRR